MNTAHIFYIPVLIMVGFFMGFFSGRRAAEREAQDAKKKRARAQRARARQNASTSNVDDGAEPEDGVSEEEEARA